MSRSGSPLGIAKLGFALNCTQVKFERAHRLLIVNILLWRLPQIGELENCELFGAILRDLMGLAGGASFFSRGVRQPSHGARRIGARIRNSSHPSGAHKEGEETVYSTVHESGTQLNTIAGAV